MTARSLGLSGLLLCSLTACAPLTSETPLPTSDTTSSTMSSASSESSMTPPSTRNVSFVGTVAPLGPSIEQEGTHALTLNDGSTILLRSSDKNLDLTTYLGKKVEVRGSVQPTVEAGGTIMSVEEVTVLEVASSSSATSESSTMCGGIANIQCPSGFTCVDNLADDCDPANGGADCSGICAPVATSSASSLPSSQAVVSSSIATSVSASRTSSSSVRSSSSSSEVSLSSSRSNLELVAMSKQNYSTSSLWTQQYCTSHIAFCISVHKNWYFKSFGATTSALWRVEFGMSDIYELNQGLIILNLMSGSSATTGGTSGQVKLIGSDAVGYLDWKGDHFEIIGDASLKNAISFMLTSIKPYTLGQ